MEKILQNYELVEMDDHYIVKVSDPVYLEYILKMENNTKAKEGEIFFTELEKIKREFREALKERDDKISRLEKKIDDLISDNRIITIPGYHETISSQTKKFIYSSLSGKGMIEDFNFLVLCRKTLEEIKLWNFTKSFDPVRNFDFLTNLSYLKKLSLNGMRNVSDWNVIGKCQLLEYFCVNDCGIDSINFFSHLVYLKIVNIDNCEKIKFFNVFKICQNLESLKLNHCKFTDFRHIERCHDLIDLYILTSQEIKNPDILKKFKKLSKIYINVTGHYTINTVDSLKKIDFHLTEES